ncbi:hypothetical protein PILCRDRAFT_827870 [Piloderma croceum F 1598]|uniref:Uncharacterized protein n=1 Tax=Piloderma croceum (strain F 1598) TaxID=765440 RepID=A0A0C3ALP2_PILCF|nr:hypothetical protein PILCRDRAFT_827870 [Piloderma croceum F 1598]
MTPSTEVGIAIALFCFLTLLLGFCIVSRSRPAPLPQRTPEAEQIAQTYERWQKNMSGPGRSARQQQLHHTHHPQTSEHYLPLYTRLPASTLSGSTVVDEHQSSPEYTNLPSPPSPAYFSHGRAETLGRRQAL